ncbi:hypothetical protein ES702_02328 [subsurface metagenome]
MTHWRDHNAVLKRFGAEAEGSEEGGCGGGEGGSAGGDAVVGGEVGGVRGGGDWWWFLGYWVGWC